MGRKSKQELQEQQLLTETENSKYWNDNSLIGGLKAKIGNKYNKYRELDKNVKSWPQIFTEVYMFNIFIYVIITSLILVLIFKLFKLN